ncbi:MAG: Galanin [Candidatus Marinimicrobia bacterium]|nr:Galanin [Candidatus Neomarinimicrobiota bacterium]
MSNISNLENLYNSELKPRLSVLNNQRVAIVNKIKKFSLYSIAPIIISIFISIQIHNPIPTIITIVISALISFFKINPLWKEYYKQFKEQVIREIIRFINNDLSYHPSDKMSQSKFTKCGIYRTGIDRYRGDDYVEGKIDSTHIEFSEIHAEYKTTTVDSKGRTQTHWYTIFKGLLFSADFNKNFNTTTYVLTDSAEKMFGFLGTKLQKMNKGRGELIKLENPEFESEFVVYSEDQIESRYILSPSLMEKILSFKKQTGKNIQLSFVDSRLFVTVPYGKDLFEPKLFGDIVNFTHIQEYYADLSLVIDLIETLNLNTRIWTKK